MENHLNGLTPDEVIKMRIGSQDYEPKWTFLSEFQLSSKGLALNDVLRGLSGPQSAHLCMELLSAMMSHVLPARSAFEWAQLVQANQAGGILRALMAAGRRDGAVTPLKNEQAPVTDHSPAQTAPVA